MKFWSNSTNKDAYFAQCCAIKMDDSNWYGGILMVEEIEVKVLKHRTKGLDNC